MLKKKRQIFNFLIFFLFLSNFASIVNAFNYRVGVHEDQEIIWKCNVCNQMEMDLIFGSEWNDSGVFDNLSVGKRMKWQINSFEINQSLSKINYSVWYWTSERVWGTKDNDSEILHFFDSVESNFTLYTSLVPFWFPIPIGEYLGSLELNEWYDVDNRVLPTINVDIEEDAIALGIPQKRIKIIAIYNDQGILNSYKLYTTGNVVIVDISIDSLPIYVIPTLIGLFTIFTVSIIIYISKIRRNT
jgi:hypothetical protein